MITMEHQNSCPSDNWQDYFVVLLPEIQQRLHYAFRNLDPTSHEEAVAEGVMHCLLSFARMHNQGRAALAAASTLAWYAALAVKRGRPAGNTINGNEPLSRYAQVSKGFHVQRFPSDWLAHMVADKRASVVDQVAAKVDISAWFATLSRRMKNIAKDLAFGFTTSEVAVKHGVTPGRISQIRRELHEAWRAYESRSAPAAM